MKDGEAPRPFDEQVVLDELERLRQSIADQRYRRRELGDEFDRFVRSMRLPAGPVSPPPSAPAVTARASEGTARTGAPVMPPPVEAPKVLTKGDAGAILDFLPETPKAVPPAAVRPPAPPPRKAPTVSAERPVPVTEPKRTPPASEPIGALPIETPRRSPMPMIAIAVGLVVLLAIAWTFLKTPPASTPAEDVTATAPAQPPAATPSSATPSSATPPAPAPSADRSELTTIRRVWVRVIADGERVVERELAADTKVAIPAKKTIVVRTGDAGAVRLVVGGKDLGALGRDGEVVTRSFDVPNTGR